MKKIRKSKLREKFRKNFSDMSLKSHMNRCSSADFFFYPKVLFSNTNLSSKAAALFPSPLTGPLGKATSTSRKPVLIIWSKNPTKQLTNHLINESSCSFSKHRKSTKRVEFPLGRLSNSSTILFRITTETLFTRNMQQLVDIRLWSEGTVGFRH